MPSVLSTGLLSLDIALGVGGIPRGRITEIFGPEACGKTTLCLSLVSEAQQLGGTCAFVDADHALDPDFAARCGVDVAGLLFSQPDDVGQALAIVERLARCGAVDLIVVDSVAGLAARAGVDGGAADARRGSISRLLSPALRGLAIAVQPIHTALVFTDQLRPRRGVLFGVPESTTGGAALKLHAAVRVELSQAGSIRSGSETLGNRLRARVVKNKLAPPFSTTEFNIMYNGGVDKIEDLLSLALSCGLIEQHRTFYSYGSLGLGQGRTHAMDGLRQNPSLIEEIASRIRQQALPASPMPVEEG